MAGVSRTTVSFILNNTQGKHISEATRQRVLKAAEALQYVPDMNAISLAKKAQLFNRVLYMLFKSYFQRCLSLSTNRRHHIGLE